MNDHAFSPARLEQMARVMSGYVDRRELPGLVTLIARNDEVVIEAYGRLSFEEPALMARDSIFRIASMTKPVVAAAAMILVEECVVRLDDPVDPWLPELANRRVLRSLDAALDDTVPANRAITLRDLLTFRAGYGVIMAMPGQYPIQRAIDEAGLAAGPVPPRLGPDDYLKRLGDLPLVHQPGDSWLYNTGSDILGMLIARASGGSLGAFLNSRIFEPLGMVDTGFSVPLEKRPRLPTQYHRDPQSGELTSFAPLAPEAHTHPPLFESGAGGLLSTASDYYSFQKMLLNQGKAGTTRILSRPSVELMTSDQLTPAQKSGSEIFFGDTGGWGFGMGVCIRRTDIFTNVGQFGWGGGTGTSSQTDPRENLAGVLLTQRMMESPISPSVFTDFWTSAYQAIAD